MSENPTVTSHIFTLLEGTWTGEGHGEAAGLKPLAQHMEALRADCASRIQPTSTN